MNDYDVEDFLSVYVLTRKVDIPDTDVNMLTQKMSFHKGITYVP